MGSFSTRFDRRPRRSIIKSYPPRSPRCCVIVSNYLEIGGNGWHTPCQMLDISNRKSRHGFTITRLKFASPRGNSTIPWHERGMRASRDSREKRGSRSSLSQTGNKSETASGIPRNLTSLWKTRIRI